MGDKATFERRVEVLHGEAFQLMLYASDDGAKKAWFWNSRDGVTPFGASIDGVSCNHAMREYRATYHGLLPDEAEFVWVDYDPSAWADMMRRKWEHFRDMDGPYGGVAFTEQFPTPESFASGEPFRSGEPRDRLRL